MQIYLFLLYRSTILDPLFWLSELFLNPSDCQKYNENMRFLGNLFFLILFIIKYDVYFYSEYLEV